LVTVDTDVIRPAEKLIDGCEHCPEDHARYSVRLDSRQGDRPEWGDDGLYFDGTGPMSEL
jgi:hypothetical protein